MSDVKRYLNQVCHIDQTIKSRQQELNDLRRNIPSASNWQQDVVSRSRENKNFVDRLVKIDEEISQKIDDLIGVKAKISKEIDQMNTYEHFIILRERYLNRKSFEYIASELNMSERHLKRLHGSALKEFSDKFSQEIDEFVKTCP